MPAGLSQVARCERCGGARSRYAADGLCTSCFGSVWVTPSSSAVGDARDASSDEQAASLTIGQLVRRARKAKELSQAQLGERLGVDFTVVSRIETGARHLRDVDELRRWAIILDIPPELFGLATPRQTSSLDPAHALFVLRDARERRALGDPVGAYGRVAAIRPLLLRWAASHENEDARLLLGELVVAHALTLGDVLPDDELAQVVQVFRPYRPMAHSGQLLDGPDQYIALTTANAVRRAGNVQLATTILEHVGRNARDPWLVLSASSLLCKCYSTLGRIPEFHDALSIARRSLSHVHETAAILNEYALNELEARDAVRHCDIVRAWRCLEAPHQTAELVASPQHRIIWAITEAEAVMLNGDFGQSALRLTEIAVAAGKVHLPHQLQRILATSERGLGSSEAFADAKEAAVRFLAA